MERSDGHRLLWLAALCFLLAVTVGVILLLQPAPARVDEPPEDAAAVFAADDSLFFAPPETADESGQSTSAPPTPDMSVSASPTAGTPASASPTPDSAAPADGFTLTVIAPASSERPVRILIYHTHTYEAYTPEADAAYTETEAWRTADERYNVVRVGEELAALLTSMGYSVTHDADAYEPPDLASSYARSLEMLLRRQAAGETYDLYIDLHRDAYMDGQTGPNALSIGGVPTARLMALVGKGEGQTSEGFDQRPDWEKNLALAQRITDSLNGQCEGLCKPVRVRSGRYNQHVAPNCVLVEVGNNRNTLSEALAVMPYLADAIRDALTE